MASPSITSSARARHKIPKPPKYLERWFGKPAIEDPLRFPEKIEMASSLSANRILDPANKPLIDSDRFQKFRNALYSRWENLCARLDKASLVFISDLSKPNIIFGVIFTLVGLIGLYTAVTGVQIPTLSFITEHIPESIIVCLTIIRAGIYSIAGGIRRSCCYERNRGEAKKLYHLQRIENFFGEINSNNLKIRQLNERQPSSMRLDNLLPAGYPYSKIVDDLPASSNSLKSYEYRLDVLKAFETNSKTLLKMLPELEIPSAVKNSPTFGLKEINIEKASRRLKKAPSGFTERWNNWWHKKMPALGMLDLITGQMMLFCAIGSIMLMFLPAAQIPAIFQLLANDPSISLSFSFILLANWVSSCQTGWRMLSWNQSQARRQSISADLQLIDLLLEVKHVKEFHIWISRQLKDLAEEYPNRKASIQKIQTAIGQSYKIYRHSLPLKLEKHEKKARRLRKESIKKSDNCIVYGIQKMGKKIVPKLANPSIMVGTIMTLLGAACLVMSVTHHIPPQFALLAKNTPLSVLFSTGLIVSGLHASHRGITMSDRNKKEAWKKESRLYREAFLEQLCLPKLHPPQVQSRHKSIRTFPKHQKLNLKTPPVNRQEQTPEIHSCCSKLSHKWFTLWRNSLHVIWPFNMLLGGFVLFSSLAGLAFYLGAPVSAGLQFISTDPRYSIIFCFSLAKNALDAFNASWRMATYHQRKNEDEANLKLLKKCYERFASPPEQTRGIRV